MKTVNFIEAINSGKRFRIVNNENKYAGTWWFICGVDIRSELTGLVSVTKNIVNEKFELEDKSITITESDFDEAFDALMCCEHVDIPMCFADQFKEKLGF